MTSRKQIKHALNALINRPGKEVRSSTVSEVRSLEFVALLQQTASS
jgi:hypothetical protein